MSHLGILGKSIPDRESSKYQLEVNLFAIFQGVTRRLVGLEQREQGGRIDEVREIIRSNKAL